MREHQSSKSWTTTLVLAWFLGIFGIHRLYTGHLKTGILYLLTCGGCGIGTFIDWVLLWTNAYRDTDGNQLMNVPSGAVRLVVALVMLSFGVVLSTLNTPDVPVRNTASRSQSQSNSTRNSRTSGYTINNVQAEQLLRGCCNGAGGVWNDGNDSCNIIGIANPDAFTGCVGYGNSVQFESGNIRPLNPDSFVY